MLNPIGLPATGQQENLSNSHTLNLSEFELLDDYEFGPDDFVITPGNGEWTREEWEAMYPAKSAVPAAVAPIGSDIYVGWFSGIVFVAGGATAVVMHWLGKFSEWGVL